MPKNFFNKSSQFTDSVRNLFGFKSHPGANKEAFHKSKSTAEHIDPSEGVTRTFSVPDAQHIDVLPMKQSRSEALHDKDFDPSPRKLDIRGKKKELAEEYEDSGYSSCSRTPTHTSKTPVYKVKYEEDAEYSSSSRTPLHIPKTPTGFIRYEEGGNNSYSSGARTPPPKASKKLSFMSQFTKDGAGAVGKDKFVKGDVLIKGVAPEVAGFIDVFSNGDIFASGEQVDFNDDDLNF